MAVALWTIRIDHGGTTNAHEAFTVEYGASTIQGSSAKGSCDCVQFNSCYIHGESVGQSYCIHGES